MKFNIGLDIDGVLADFYGAAQALIGAKHNHNLGIHRTEWWTKGSAWDAVVDKLALSKELYRYLLPIPGAIAGTKDLASIGRVFYITARPAYLRDTTLGWLAMWEFADRPLIMVNKGGTNPTIGNAKVHAAKELEIDVYVDDRPDTVQEFVRAGITAFGFAHYDLPYVRVYEQRHPAFFVRTWDELFFLLSKTQRTK